ncbi:NAD-dependent epimerase/dehydratase family protein [Pararhizobium mangrovi]|uniref:NAD-dependent epimerase/dehydratase family protein n=1 Tax=Pararhizobium mangrovi TaxID=2590452 RepID=A0A506U1E0_9HYPH|nr:NAD-dependent epimerase/dehydratase family protein [Pararhizobium mangrovi]TPW27570.1 NAD-dependent epimerase/dehydratase family protein [Pararhizobium mangrovi]
MTTLVTGAAGFIGYHVSRHLLERGDRVVGIDDLNPYYDVGLKTARLEGLRRYDTFAFNRGDIAEEGVLRDATRDEHITHVVHLAAQAGVRHSIDNPHVYARSNVVGHLQVLEYCRHNASLQHLVYASSSSVYGGNTKVPFSEDDRVDTPVSLYAATKRADELMSASYAHLYGFRQTGIRFFTVYGPLGRPDMAYWLFTEAMRRGAPIRLFDAGRGKRDFTYIDDAVKGVLSIHDSPRDASRPAHAIYNIGNNRPEPVGKMVSTLESLLGVKAKIEELPAQPGDMAYTAADIDAIQRDFSFSPDTPLETGLEAFVSWYRDFCG